LLSSSAIPSAHSTMGACSCLALLTAKTLVALFSLIMLALSVATVGVGIFSISQFLDTFLADAIPAWASYTALGVGIVMVLFSLYVLLATLMCSQKSKCSIFILFCFTLTSCVFFSAATVVSFRYSEVMRIAAETGFDDDVSSGIESFYMGMRDAYVKAYVQCNATAYMTSNVKAACKTQAALGQWNTLNVSECTNDTYDGGVDHVGLYCRDGPGLTPFTVDRALGFPPPSEPFDFADMLRLRSLGYFMSAVCMPTTARYYDLMQDLIVLATPGVFLPPGVKATATNSVFGKCYKSQWWSQRQENMDAQAKAAAAADPSIPDGFKALPNGTRLTGDTKRFFDGLQISRAALLGNPLMSAKLSFCFCADEGANSKLLTFLRERVFKNLQWICLGLAIFLGLALLSEIYLGCCVRREAQEERKPEQLVMRGWQAGASSNNLGQPKKSSNVNYIVRP